MKGYLKFCFMQPSRLTTSDTGCVKSRTNPDYIAKRKFARPPGLQRDFPVCLGLGNYVHSTLFKRVYIVDVIHYLIVFFLF